MEASQTKSEEERMAAAKAEYEKLLNMRSGGTYIPPARLRALQSQITDKTTKEYQRMAWEALKKSINGLINKVNVSNIKHIVPELFGENLIRGRGLFCRSIMKAQAASLPFTPIYAAMAAIVNTKLPNVGELLLKRLIMQFKKGFKRNDKAVCLSATTFIAHLCNQQVSNEVVAAQILLLLLHKPTDDSVEIAVGLTREVGQHLEEMNQVIALAVFDQFRNILHEADIDKRVQYMIEVLFQIRKDKYKDHPAIKEELDLVEEEDQITHVISLDDDIDVSEGLNIFKYDPDWEANEEKYNRTKAEIFGEVSDDEDDGSKDASEESEDDEEEKHEDRAIEIKDQSNADLVALRKTIYLTIMSSIDPEECCHKLIKVNLPGGLEPELPSMVIECCSQEKTYSKFYGLVGEQFAKINRLWTQLFEESFAKYYETIHRYETNRLRNIARFFGHLLSSDGIGWHVLSVVHLSEDETTASSRIFIKILFEDIVEAIGLPRLQARLMDDTLRPYVEGMFPMNDNHKNTRFSINYFTSIKMGLLTEEMREYLAKIPKPALPAIPIREYDSGSDSNSVTSYSTDTGSSNSNSRSVSRSITSERRRSLSPIYRNTRTRTRSRTRSISSSVSFRGRRKSYSRSISPLRRRSRDTSSSRSPVTRERKRARRHKYSDSPPSRRRRSRSLSESQSPRRSYPSQRKISQYTSRGRRRVRRRRNTSSVSVTPKRRRGRSSSSASPRRHKNISHLQSSASRRSLRKSSRSSTPSRRSRRQSSYSQSRSPHRKIRRTRSRTRSRSILPPIKRRRNYSSSSSAPSKRGRQ